MNEKLKCRQTYPINKESQFLKENNPIRAITQDTLDNFNLVYFWEEKYFVLLKNSYNCKYSSNKLSCFLGGQAKIQFYKNFEAA